MPALFLYRRDLPAARRVQLMLLTATALPLLVNFDGFREVVDDLGGVSMHFPRPVRDDNGGRNQSGLDVGNVGCRRLDGDQVLATQVKKPTTPTRPPKPTAATRALPSWDCRPC